MPTTERDVNYNPRDGEWISKALYIEMVERGLKVPQETMDEFREYAMDLTEVFEPTGEEVGSPHSDVCVARQRGSLCYWVCETTRRLPNYVFTSGQMINLKLVCNCLEEKPLLRGYIRRDTDGKWDVGYLKEGAEMLV